MKNAVEGALRETQDFIRKKNYSFFRTQNAEMKESKFDTQRSLL